MRTSLCHWARLAQPVVLLFSLFLALFVPEWIIHLFIMAFHSFFLLQRLLSLSLVAVFFSPSPSPSSSSSSHHSMRKHWSQMEKKRTSKNAKETAKIDAMLVYTWIPLSSSSYHLWTRRQYSPSFISLFWFSCTHSILHRSLFDSSYHPLFDHVARSYLLMYVWIFQIIMVYSHLTDEEALLWKDLKGNFTQTPNYLDLVKGIWNTISWYYRPIMWKNYRFPQSFIDDFTRHFHFPLNQVLYIVYIAVFITALRYLFERKICKVCSSFDREWFSLHSSIDSIWI